MSGHIHAAHTSPPRISPVTAHDSCMALTRAAFGTILSPWRVFPKIFLMILRGKRTVNQGAAWILTSFSVGLEHRFCQYLVSFADFHAWAQSHRDECTLKGGCMVCCYTDDVFVMSSVTLELKKWRGNAFVLPSQIVIARVLITD